MRESLRLAAARVGTGELGAETPAQLAWVVLWERYVESQTDYRAGSETLARKLA